MHQFSDPLLGCQTELRPVAEHIISWMAAASRDARLVLVPDELRRSKLLSLLHDPLEPLSRPPVLNVRAPRSSHTRERASV